MLNDFPYLASYEYLLLYYYSDTVSESIVMSAVGLTCHVSCRPYRPFLLLGTHLGPIISAIGLCRPIVSVDRPYLTLSELCSCTKFPTSHMSSDWIPLMLRSQQMFPTWLNIYRPNVTDVSKTGSMLLALRGSGGQISSKKCYVTHEWPLTLTLKHNLTLP